MFEITNSQPPVSETTVWETELATEKFERYKSEVNVQIQAELKLSEVKTSFSNKHKIILFI